MITVNQTPTFKKWMSKLRDIRAKARILFRLTQVEGGNLGDYIDYILRETEILS